MHKRCIAFFLLFSSAVHAETTPPEIAPYVHATTPYGKAVVNYTFFTVYDATLWTDAKPFTTNKPFALRLKYRHAFPTSGLVKKTVDEMARIDNVSEGKLKAYADQLNKLWPSVKAGDVITAVNIPDQKTVFFYNGTMTGAINDPEFNRPFFDVWFSPKTSEPEARKSLLGDH